MTTKSKRKQSGADGEDALTGDALIEAQQKMMRADDAPRGYLGRGTAEEQDAEAARMHKIVNAPHVADGAPVRNVRPAMIGRDPDAEVEDEGGAGAGNHASRVGFIPVQHPRASTARALHDLLGERALNDLTVDELHESFESVGLTVDGTGANGTVLKSDLVQAGSDLLADYPRAAS